MVPLRIVIITKTDPLKKSLPKFAQPGAGCFEDCVCPIYDIKVSLMSKIYESPSTGIDKSFG